MLTAQVAGHTLKARLRTEIAAPAPGTTVWLQVLSDKTCFYGPNEELVA
jgi:glycerol transport system ATP-binding protein